MDQQTVNRTVVIGLAFAISALFLTMVSSFLVAIFLAGLFSALANPVYQSIRRFIGGSQTVASLLTVLLGLLFVFVPILLIAITVIGQAVDIATQAKPWLQSNFSEPGQISVWLSQLPFYEQLLPYRELLLEHLGKIIGKISQMVVDLFQSATVGTVNVAVTAFVVFYTIFFFLIDGDGLVKRILYYLPLEDRDEKMLLDRFTAVTRATLKGTAVIGFLQGSLAGLGFWVLGVPSALLWAVVMMFMSVVPGVGGTLIWGPAVIYLLSIGDIWQGVALLVYCAAIVGSIDNVLRPKLVGNDTQLHELMIFFSTLGGLMMFGFPGFIIGPIIAALFVTVWEIYGFEFKEWLPDTAFRTRAEQELETEETKRLAEKQSEKNSETNRV